MLFVSCKYAERNLPEETQTRETRKITILPVLSAPQVNKIGTKTCQGMFKN